MTPKNSTAPVLADRGGRDKSALETQRKTSTRRLPWNWRERLPTPADYYAREVSGLGLADADGWALAPCPLGPQPHANLRVRLDGTKGIWDCSTCDDRGDLVGFHMRRHALRFPDAVRAILREFR